MISQILLVKHARHAPMLSHSTLRTVGDTAAPWCIFLIYRREEVIWLLLIMLIIDTFHCISMPSCFFILLQSILLTTQVL